MATHSEDPNAPIEGTVFNERQVRILKYVVIGLGILLLLGFALVITTIVYQASQLGEGSGSESSTASQNLTATSQTRVFSGPAIPAGAKVVSTAIDGSRVAITIEKAGTVSILVIDTRSGKLLSRTELATKK